MDSFKTMSFSHCSIVFPQELYQTLNRHLFRGDHNEHGAIIAAGITRSSNSIRFLARDLFLARDGQDYVPGKHGYRMLRAEFIYDRIRYCRENGFAYFAIHNHGGFNRVSFSPDDISSHERGYPALLDVMQGLPVGALVFAPQAMEADIWFQDGKRYSLEEARVIGSVIQRLYSTPEKTKNTSSPMYDRQILLFGERGQEILAKAKIGIIGAGGAGSLLIEYLARLGVGHLVVSDPDRIELSNLSRVVGAHRFDALYPFSSPRAPKILQQFAAKNSKQKTSIGKRIARQSNPKIIFEAIPGNFAYESVAKHFINCDFLFLAADSMQSRLVFNAIVHQYLIPGIQIGAKVLSDDNSEQLLDCYSVSRWILPDTGCLWCNGLISPQGLAWEAKTDRERNDQRYGTESQNPSVISMNAVAASHAANDFLMSFLGLAKETAPTAYQRYKHLTREIVFDRPRKDISCAECGRNQNSRFAKGDLSILPTIPR